MNVRNGIIIRKFN